MKNILIITKSKFPSGDAGALRYFYLSRIFQELGFKVEVIGMGEGKYNEVHTFSQVVYYTFRTGNKLINRVLDNLLFSYRVKKHLNLSINKLNLILMGGTYSNQMCKSIKKLSAKYGVPIVYNIMEWYSPKLIPTDGLFSRVGHFYNTNFMKWFDSSYGSVISISSHLNNYFLKKKVNSIRIPFVIDSTKVTRPRHIPNNKTIFIYLGNPGKKDDIAIMIRGFNLLNEEEKQLIEVFFVGFDKKQTKTYFNDLSASYMHFIHKVPHNETLTYFANADFTILMRPPNERYAMSGFPTKFTESLFMGVPVISNLTSDIGLYLKDGYNGLIVDTYSDKSFSSVIRVAIKLSQDEKFKMRENAYTSALNALDIMAFKDNLSDFLESLI